MEHEAIIRDLQTSVDRLREELDKTRQQLRAILDHVDENQAGQRSHNDHTNADYRRTH